MAAELRQQAPIAQGAAAERRPRPSVAGRQVRLFAASARNAGACHRLVAAADVASIHLRPEHPLAAVEPELAGRLRRQKCLPAAVGGPVVFHPQAGALAAVHLAIARSQAGALAAARPAVCFQGDDHLRGGALAAARLEVCSPAAARLEVCSPEAARLEVYSPAAARLEACSPEAVHRAADVVGSFRLMIWRPPVSQPAT